MSKIDLISGEWTDMVFAGRNQAYGAYALRKGTGRRNVIAILAVVFLAIAFWGGLKLKNIADEEARRKAAMTQVTELSALTQKKKEAKVERKEMPKIEQVQKVVEKVKSSVKFTAPVIKKDEEVQPEDELKSQEDLMKSSAAIGSFDVVGNDEEGEVLKAKEVIAQEPVQPKEETKVFDVVEQMPSYPGGMGALMQYLSNNIKYPVIAEENGIQGRVICTFIVERDGSITDVKVAKSVDPSLDKEAMRVIKSMPNWIPGKQNGSAVRVKFTLPVTFRLQ